MNHACEREYLVCWDFVFLDDIYTHLRAFLDPVSHLCLAFTSHAHRRYAGPVITKCQLCEAITSIGSVELMEWASTIEAPLSPLACTHAAKTGHLEMVKWFAGNGLPSCLAQECAAFGGHVHILEWWHSERYTICEYDLGCHAIHGDKICVLDWLLEKSPNTHFWGVSRAATRDNSDDLICWIYEKGRAELLDIPIAAIEKDSVPLIERLLKAGCVWTRVSTHYAREAGSIALLEWAKTRDLIK
jgi:hypothetical protein